MTTIRTARVVCNVCGDLGRDPLLGPGQIKAAHEYGHPGHAVKIIRTKPRRPKGGAR